VWVEGEKSITGQFSQDLTQKQPSCFSGGVVAGGSSHHASANHLGKKEKLPPWPGSFSRVLWPVIGAKAQNEMW